MIILHTKAQFSAAKPLEKTLPVECEYCGIVFYTSKHRVQQALNPKCHTKIRFCSIRCNTRHIADSRSSPVEVCCEQCGALFVKKASEIARTAHNFCNSSCSGTYYNAHKTHGVRRSRLEAYLEEQLRTNLPYLKVLCNDKTTINSELDFYFPELSVAIEVSGIFHYMPIYGEDKLRKIQRNDARKAALCEAAGIRLEIIDISRTKHLTERAKGDYWVELVRLLWQ